MDGFPTNDNGPDKPGFKLLSKEDLARENVRDMLALLEWNEANGIHVYRMSSDMFPHITNPKAPSYTIDCAKTELSAVAQFLAAHPHHRCPPPHRRTSLYHQPCMTVVWHTVSLSFVRAPGLLRGRGRDGSEVCARSLSYRVG